MNKSLLRVEEAASALAVSRWTIYRWVEQGRLEGTKIGRGSLRVFSSSVEKLVEQNKIEMVSSEYSNKRVLVSQQSFSPR